MRLLSVIDTMGTTYTRRDRPGGRFDLAAKRGIPCPHTTSQEPSETVVRREGEEPCWYRRSRPYTKCPTRRRRQRCPSSVKKLTTPTSDFKLLCSDWLIPSKSLPTSKSTTITSWSMSGEGRRYSSF